MIAALAAMAGLTQLTWRDDVRELEVPAKALQAEGRPRDAMTRHLQTAMNRIDEVFEGKVLVLDEAADTLAAQSSARPSRVLA